MRTAVVELKQVNKIFGTAGENQTVGLKDIDLVIEAGEFVSLIGPSGCGKSTLLRLVADLIPPTSGEVKVNGKPAHQARLDHDYGIVFQAPVLFEWRTILNNVKLPLELFGYKKEQQEKVARDLLALVELTGFEKHYPWQLSGGMQQRASIARALATRPELLLMDEPFGALDEMTRERMNNELHDIWRHTHTTVLFVTHSIPEAVYLSTRVLIMSARPGEIMHTVDVDLPFPRDEQTRRERRYFEITNEVRDWLRKAEGFSG